MTPEFQYECDKEIYEKYFEAPFQEETKNYYTLESSKLIESLTC